MSGYKMVVTDRGDIASEAALLQAVARLEEVVGELAGIRENPDPVAVASLMAGTPQDIGSPSISPASPINHSNYFTATRDIVKIEGRFYNTVIRPEWVEFWLEEDFSGGVSGCEVAGNRFSLRDFAFYAIEGAAWKWLVHVPATPGSNLRLAIQAVGDWTGDAGAPGAVAGFDLKAIY